MANKVVIQNEEIREKEFEELSDKVQRFQIGKERGEGSVAIQYHESDIMELEFHDGTSWIGAAEDLHHISSKTPKTRDGETTLLPLELESTDKERGIASIILSAFSIIHPKAKPLYNTLHEAISSLEDVIKEEGLYRLDNQFEKTKINGAIREEEDPYLLFIHGTLSTTEGSFDKLFENKAENVWGQLSSKYKEKILSFEHKTLTKSPLENVLDLVKKLPKKVKLHLVTHSRGGIVGDILNYVSDSNFDATKCINPDRKNDLKLLNAIKEEVKTKEISILKFIRVACPSAGTTLLSERYTDYLNALVNILRVVAPGASEIVNRIRKIIVAIYSLKNEEDVLPGLEAMVPGSDFQIMLNKMKVNSPDTSVLVIAGDGVVSLSLKGLGTILFNLFYFHDNDWIVDTESMDKGAKRSTNVFYQLTQHREVNHFSYFNNSDTREALAYALTRQTKEWENYFQSRAVTDYDDSRGILSRIMTGNELYPDEYFNAIEGKKPIIVLIPGVLGSNLYEVTAKQTQRIFLEESELISGGFVTKLNIKNKNIQALSVSGKAYGEFVKYFKERYDVIVFPYDWRKSVKDSANILAKRILEIKQKAKDQTISIVAHSMGGLVARHFAQQHPAMFSELAQKDMFKLLFLGSPLRGAYIVPQILLGKGTIFNAFALLDFPHNGKSLMQVFREYEGLLNLLPIQDHRGFEHKDAAVWGEFSQHVSGFQTPSLTELNHFIHEIQEVEPILYSNKNVFYIAGASSKTVTDYEIRKSFFKGSHIHFLATDQGDGKVTWASGIPKKLKEEKRVYYTYTEHGDLAADDENFKGIEELLQRGSTTLLLTTPPADRSGEEVISSFEDTPVFDTSEESLHNAIFGKRKSSKKTKQVKVNVSVTCGDVGYVKYPVMVGHFKNDGIYSAEKAINSYLGKRLALKHELKIYPEDIGSSEVIENKRNKPAAIVVGLGEQFKLTSSTLERTLTQGVVNYMLHCNNELNQVNELGLSVLLIGSSYAGLPLDTSVKSLVAAVNNANEMVLQRGLKRCITQLEFIELFEDKAVQALRTLLKEEKENKFNSPIKIIQTKVKKHKGRRKRILYENTDDWWSQLYILDQRNAMLPKDIVDFRFSVTSSTAKIDVRNNPVDIAVVHSIMDELAKEKNWNMDKAKMVFEMLIPNDFKGAVRSKQHIQLMLDSSSAELPWELLHDTKTYFKPLATQVGLIRRLEFDDAFTDIYYVAEQKALVIGDPDLGDPDKQLPQAKKEAEMVADILKTEGYTVTPLINSNHNQIIQALNADNYKIIHLAGHGEYKGGSTNEILLSGMITGDGKFLSSNFIANLSYVPDLVFINCCHIGKVVAKHLTSPNKQKLAASISLQLMKKGVKCVIAAAWAVDDKAAKRFTEVFYDRIFHGENFGEAVKEARLITYTEFPNKNTWAAYQCYGDQTYSLGNGKYNAEVEPYFEEEEIRMDLRNLINQLDIEKYGSDHFIKNLDKIDKRIEDSLFRKSSGIHSMFGDIYSQIREYDLALNNYKKAIELASTDLPADCLDNVNWMRYKKYYSEISNGNKSEIDLEKDILSPLLNLMSIRKTYKRCNLLGSIYKMKAGFAKNADDFKKFLLQSHEYYLEGSKYTTYEEMNTIYPLSNSLLMKGIHDILSGEKKKREAYLKQFTEAYDLCKDKLDTTDYWHKMVETNYLFIMTMFSSKEDYPELKAKLFTAVKQAWATGGSINKKISELEHLDMLLKMYQNIPVDLLNGYERDLEMLKDFKQHLLKLDNPESEIFD